MRYRGTLTIHANTPQVLPATVTMSLTYGKIQEVVVLFPAGCGGLVHLIVLYHERQILPTSPEQSFIGDDHLITFPERFPIYDEPFEVKLVGWSPGTTLSHTLYVDMTVEAEIQPTVIYSGSVPLPSKG